MSKKNMIIRISAFSLALLLFSFFSYGEGLKVAVTVTTANVRLNPSLDSPVIGKATMGQILTVQKKVGDWYLVELPPNEKGAAVQGYVHKSVVQEFVEPSSGQKKESPALKKETSAAKTVQKKAGKPMTIRTERKKFFVRLGAGYGTKTFSYSNNWAFTMYAEQGQATEKYSVDNSGLAIDIGLGYMFTPSVGVELSFAPVSGKSKGTFTGSFPHPFYFNLPRNKQWTANSLKYSASEINLDVLYAMPLTSKINFYVMGGGTYFLGVKIETLKVINWTEIGYPYFDLNITPEYPSYSASSFGFNAAAGVDYQLAQNIAANLNVRYSSGTAKIKVEGRDISLKPGGVKATAGVKFAF